MIKKNLLIVLLIINIFFSSKVLSEKIIILYKVENTPVTNLEIKNEISYLLLINENLRNVDQDDLVEYAKQSILKETIKKLELKKYYEFGKNPQVVNKYLKILINNLNLENQDQFNQLISSVNLTNEYIEKKIEVEFLWNNLIFKIYNEKIAIDEKKIRETLKKKISNQSNEIDEYLLYQIIFSGNNKDDLDKKYMKIIESIEQIGFENTANIFSDTNSSNIGGRIGWLNENQLSDKILQEINKLNVNEYSNPINISNGKLILMLKEKRKTNKNLSIDDELKKIINKEKNDQLEEFSLIHYKKIELKTNIYEN